MYKLTQIVVETLAKIYLWRFNPQIIGITGNVGKTSTKEAIGLVVSKIKKVRVGGGNLNNEIGLPFNIISDSADEYYEKGGSLAFGIKSFFKAIIGFFNSNYPEVLVLEYGADRPGDIKKLSKRYKPHIGVVTAVGEVPVHVEYFSGPDAVAREKGRLIEALLISDFAVLNFDDLAVLEMKERTKAKVFTYGFGDGAMVQVSNLEPWIENGVPEGVGFKINYNDSFVPFKLSGSLGKSQGYASAAAAAVGAIFGMNLVDISEALSEYHGPKGRLKILKGIKNSVVIDDSYNASPLSTHLALETLRDLPGTRRIAVLGDMLELGKYTIKAHQDVGNMAGNFVNLLICVGSRAKFIADSAFNQMPAENIYRFETSDEAKLKVKELIKEGDLVLVKGSQGMRMEKIVEEIVADPPAGRGTKKELLVRQSKKWLSK
jgi:UDP-N-acetylmuramoyl-tripeptide--D-alanyl-D-alanine ligase